MRKRVIASFLALSLVLGVLCPVQAKADMADWPSWVSEALQTTTVDLATALWGDKWGGDPATLGGWATQYVSSATMAQAVRETPAYRELYGYNPLDKSTVIRSYDGGDQVSVLTPEGYIDAYLWLHDGIPPEGESGGGSTDLPTGGRVFINFADSLGDTVTFQDGAVLNFASSNTTSYRDTYNSAAGYGQAVFLIASGSGGTASPLSTPKQIYHWISGVGAREPIGDVGISIRFTPLATAMGVTDTGYDTSFLIRPLSSVVYSSSSPSNENNFGYGNLDTSVSNSFDGPSGFFTSSNAVRFYPPQSNANIYIITNSSVWAYGSWTGGQSGPAPEPEPVPPVGPSEPDIQNPDVTDPSSDTPIQNTTVNVTVTLPDGSTTVVQAPTADLSSIVHWLSIINANLVAWSKTIKDTLDGWGGNISDWLSQIWKTLDAFRQAVDNWSVSILTAIDQLGGGWPMDGEDNVNYWNNVYVVNNNVWASAPTANDVNVVSRDLERLKTKFPFSIPWDLAAILLLFKADPVTPEFSVPLVYFDGSTETQPLVVDLDPFDSTMATWRRLVFIAFAGALAYKTKDLLAYVNDTFDFF